MNLWGLYFISLILRSLRSVHLQTRLRIYSLSSLDINNCGLTYSSIISLFILLHHQKSIRIYLISLESPCKEMDNLINIFLGSLLFHCQSNNFLSMADDIWYLLRYYWFNIVQLLINKKNSLLSELIHLYICSEFLAKGLKDENEYIFNFKFRMMGDYGKFHHLKYNMWFSINIRIQNI